MKRLHQQETLVNGRMGRKVARFAKRSVIDKCSLSFSEGHNCAPSFFLVHAKSTIYQQSIFFF